MVNLNKDDIIELFKKESDEFIKLNFSTKALKEMYFVLTGHETTKSKDALLKSLRSRTKVVK